ncbi:MAG: prolipoprotein diacylglyceryl transferase family protein [Polyangiaceae bacterium]
MPLKLWWALAAIAAVSFIYAIAMQRKAIRDSAMSGVAVAILAGGTAYYFRETQFEALNLPIYSYGVMLGLSLVVGWYLTLTLAERDGLPKETMANCYVVTAIAAIVGSRVLYIVTNLDEFKTAADLFALRRGGLVAYGGFIGGYFGSWAFLARHKIRLMSWADVAVPSLASGLMITRVGCYLFGCDFGKRLPEGAPGFLKKLGTFPHWAQGTIDGGDGSPAFIKHLESYRGTPLGAELLKNNASLPVHPTQIYESLVGLTLLAILLLQRRHQKFRGQIFFTFVFGYGFLRFLLEIIRDDAERGEYGPVMAEHILVPGALLLLSLGFVFGIALGIKNPTARMVARVVAFVPPIVAYVVLKPASFGSQMNVQLSTSQLIGLFTGLIVSYFYARYWQDARKNPHMAMALGVDGDLVDEERTDDTDEERAEAEEEAEEEADAPTAEGEEMAAAAPVPRRAKKGLKKKKPRKEEPTEDDDDAPAGDPAES